MRFIFNRWILLLARCHLSKIKTEEKWRGFNMRGARPYRTEVGRFGSGLVLTQNRPDNSGTKNCSPEFTRAVPGRVLSRFYGSF